MRKMRVLLFWQMSIVLLAFLVVGDVPAAAGTFTAFGPQNYVRGTGSPVTVTNSFTILNPSTQYTLKAFNGGLVNDQTELVSSTVVTVNGVQVLGENNFNQNVQEVDVPVVLQSTNTISVQVRGQPGGTLTIQIVGVDNAPPFITATVSPTPNAAGWNTADVTVTFTCSDAISGVANCPPPQTVTGDVASQTVTGTATDRAGNSASTSVIVKIDRTPPAIIASISPAPNSSGWNKSDVTVTFTCTDAMSGIQNCPAAQSLTGESARQTISGTATDKAGNSATTSVTVKIDKTPPAVSVASPPNGSSISLSTVAIGLNGSVSDGLSGVSSVTCNGSPGAISGSNFTCTVLLTQGPNSISVQATDVAGNSSASALALTYAPAPQIAITSPANLSITNLSPSTVVGTVSDPNATITVNGIRAPQSGGSFAIPVPLVEGLNVLTAVATNAGGVVSTATVQVTLDTTPPHITVDSPLDGATTTAAAVTVTGLANDIVIGTVNAQDVQVTVNGLSAQVANRTYAAVDVPLTLGKNIIQAIARDHAGNSSSTSIAVTRVLPSQPPAPAIGTAVISQSLKIVSGNNQTGTIGAQLAQPLVVALSDPANNPVANQTVVFKVTGNNGSVSAAGGTPSLAVAVTTDVNGQAQALWTLGGRAGAGINTVQASSSLAVGTASFTATGTNANASQIVVDSGNNQTGVLGQPLGFPFVADVVDNGHNRVPNVPVTFTIKQGDGTFGGAISQTVSTDSNGRAIAVLTLGTQIGNDNNLVEANFAGDPGSPAAFTASGRAPGNPASTTVSGVVLDNSNNPIPGVTVRLFQTNQGNANNLPVQVGTPVQTAVNGTFLIQPAPVGFFKLMADGTTAPGPNSYPTLEYDLVTVAGNDNTVGMPIYLPALDTVNKLCVDDTHGGTLTLPQVPGFALTVPAGSATFPGGSRQGCVTVTVVNGDKVPMAPGFGQQPRFIVSIQPVGTRFDPPAPMTLPNVDGLQPRAVTEMYSYDHDLGMFVAIGTGTVSADGSVIASNPGVGVLKAGWHCGGDPNSSGSAGSLGVTLSASTTQAPAGSPVTLTANGTPPLDGQYINWEIVPNPQDPNDNPSAATFQSQPNCLNQPSCAAQLVGTEIGDVTVRVTFQCTTTGATVTSNLVTISFNIGLKVKEVSFLNGLSINKDQIGSITPITNPIWKDTNAPADNNPAGYVQGSTMSATVKFAIDPAPTTPVTNVTIQGNIPGLGNFTKTGVTLPAAAEVTVNNIAADTALPSGKTKFYNPMTVNWSHMADGKTCPACTTDGSTSHLVYVTLATPTATIYLTSLNIAVSTDGASNNTQAINNSWAFFGNGKAPTDVKGWDGRPFIYYPAGIPFSGCATSIVGLLTTATGGARCGAFAEFFQNVLAMNGINSVITVVDPAVDNGMLVKSWSYSTTPTFPADPSYKWAFITIGFNEMFPPPNPATPTVYGDMTSNTGVPGENSQTPSEKAHINHAIVCAPDTGVFYDPSYGLTYSGAADFETQALDGYILHFPGDPTSQYHVRKSSGLNMATFTPATCAP